MKGTPTTLNQAILNGLENISNLPNPENNQKAASEIIERHVKDFLAQRFMAIVANENNEIADVGMQLFRRVTAKNAA